MEASRWDSPFLAVQLSPPRSPGQCPSSLPAEEHVSHPVAGGRTRPGPHSRDLTGPGPRPREAPGIADGADRRGGSGTVGSGVRPARQRVGDPGAGPRALTTCRPRAGLLAGPEAVTLHNCPQVSITALTLQVAGEAQPGDATCPGPRSCWMDKLGFRNRPR